MPDGHPFMGLGGYNTPRYNRGKVLLSPPVPPQPGQPAGSPIHTSTKDTLDTLKDTRTRSQIPGVTRTPPVHIPSHRCMSSPFLTYTTSTCTSQPPGPPIQSRQNASSSFQKQRRSSVLLQSIQRTRRSSSADVVANLKNGKEGWSCERVMKAYIRSACAAHRKTNCLTEVLFKTALQEARDKDAEKARGGEPSGAFWGLPSSFKDTYNIVGVDTSLGCSPHCFKPTEHAHEEGSLVILYRKAGGIPFCKTGIPQTLLAFESSNPIFGKTSNPYSSARTSGGSSGGEAALIALNGTPVGWGSDIGGSIRIPSGYSGCCGLKPAVGRWATGGNRAVTKGFDGIKAVVGPMARSVDDLTFQSRSMINMTLQELSQGRFATENLIPLPWREPMLAERLRIGYYIDDGAIKTSPACARAVMQTVEALRKEGHELVEWKPPNAYMALKIFVALTSADGYRQLLSNLGKDPMEKSMRLVTLGPRLPKFILWLLTRFVTYILKDFIFGTILAGSKRKTAGELWNAAHERDEYIKCFRKNAWEDNKFDFLLCPVQAVPALEHGRTADLSPLCIGTLLYNVVDSTAGVVPVTRVDAERDALPNNFLADAPGSWLLNKKVYGTEDPAYDAKKMHNLPVGVQIVGRQWEEEKVLAVMKLIENSAAYR